jgi:hypothetical protein
VHKPKTRSTTGDVVGSTYAWSTFSSTYVTDILVPDLIHLPLVLLMLEKQDRRAIK